MKVLKFGGTSVGSADRILQVIDIIKNKKSNQEDIVVVLSAMGGVTNKLVEMSTRAENGDESYLTLLKEFENTHIDTIRSLIDVKEQSAVFAHLKQKLNELEDVLQGVFMLKELSHKSSDFILSHGERLNAFMIAAATNQRGVEASFLDAREVVKTDSNFGSAKIKFKATNENLKNYFKNRSEVVFMTGFIASDDNGVTTTLGRGGSDYSASILAAALDAEEVEIWTDVDGVMTADPRKVKNAFSLPAISYQEAMELSHFGAKVIYPPTLLPVFTKRIPISIKNTFNPTYKGTYISEKSGEAHRYRVKGISSINDVALVEIQGSGMIGVTGVAARIFSALAQHQINVILITQASSETSICFAVSPEDALRAKKVIEAEYQLEIEAKRIDKVKIEDGLSIIALIGENMRNTPGISGKMFRALGRNGINTVAIAQGSSELNISAVIHRTDISKALNALHDEFFLADARTLNVFMVGPGLIGSELLEQVKDQQAYLVEKRQIFINVVAIANSRKMVFDQDGIDLNDWKGSLESGEENTGFGDFIAKMKQLNLPNSVFVDNTSNKELATHYATILDASVNIVTPNKVANSSTFEEYKRLKDTAFNRGVKFLYETNVGAGLPVINTLQDLIHSGDEILSIEGVLSGSLSYIFNTYDGSTTFKEVVLQAKENGFTEPDPRDDLNGMDVARKILILSREAGLPLEPEDVKIENILPQACIEASTVDIFFEELEKNDAVFKDLSEKASSENKKLRFIATLKDNQVTVGLRSVDAAHPFYGLAGSDNMISYTTKRYEKNPLVIKGPGAGAAVTAAGVFADIIRISNR